MLSELLNQRKLTQLARSRVPLALATQAVSSSKVLPSLRLRQGGPAAMPFPASFFERFHQQAPQVFFVYEVAAQRVSYISPAYERVLRGHCEQVNEELPALLARVHLDDRDHADDCWQRGQLHEPFELRLRWDEDDEQHLCITPHQQTGTEGRLLVGGLIEDTTAKMTLLWYADKYNSKKNTTLEIVSHDLVGPLAQLAQMSDYLQDSVAPLQNPQLVTMIEHMRALCHDSVTLIRDYIDTEFLDSVNVELKRERINLVQKLRLVMEQYQAANQHVGKHFAFVTSEAALYLEIDQNKFMLAVNNLISNAIEFTPDGGTITVSVRTTTGAALVTVADTGVGIPVPMQAGLFEKFTKARRPGLRGERSTGLGMSIIKTIVELHGGRITVESAEAQGTTFTITLPLADQELPKGKPA